jgi:hypothetical protein
MTQGAATAAADAAADAAARVAAQAAQSGASPAQIYRALRDQGNILREQLRGAQNLRERLVQELRQTGGLNNDAVRTGIEKRIANVDARIGELDKQIAVSDQAVANAAAVPGATISPPPPPRRGPPEEAFVLGGLFMFIVFLPLSIAYARRIWRRSAKAEVRLPQEMSDRMESLERGVEAIAIEVERIGEGQRFVTQALAERLEPRAGSSKEPQPAYLRPGERAETRR